MASTFLKRNLVSRFLEILAGFGEVHGPVRTDDGVLAYAAVKAPADIDFNYSRSLIPPKKYLLHPRDTLLNYHPEQGYKLPSQPVPEIVLLGLHPCDLQGIAYLDAVFMGDRIDPLYKARRKALTLIGLSCEPDDFCFCGDLSATERSGCDLFMREVPDGFELIGGSPKGKGILDALAPHVVEAASVPAENRTCEMAETIRQASLRGEKFDENHLWADFAARCLSCGACSLCCPTCYCFDVRENGGLDGETAQRLREWDNCLFKGHGEVAGGINFRKNRLERFHYRYQHKYLGFGPTRGMVSCVGCGRCREVCPVKIDLLELFEESR